MNKKTMIEHVKCQRCKCWRTPDTFLNDKGRKLKSCSKCRLLSKKYRDLKKAKKTSFVLPKDLINIIIEYNSFYKNKMDHVISYMNDIFSKTRSDVNSYGGSFYSHVFEKIESEKRADKYFEMARREGGYSFH